jgi:hypothetical protein
MRDLRALHHRRNFPSSHSEPILLITPDWVPYPSLAVAITGVCEIAGGVGLLIPRLQRAAGFMLSVYAVCVFPANLKHAFQGMHVQSLPDGWWYMLRDWRSSRCWSGFRSIVPHSSTGPLEAIDTTLLNSVLNETMPAAPGGLQRSTVAI